MSISRRWFLIGSAAALAATQLPAAEALAEKVHFTSRLKLRSVSDVQIIGVAPYSPAIANSASFVTLYRDDAAVFHVGLAGGMSYRWAAIPGNELLFAPHHTLRVKVDGDLDLHVDLVGDSDDGPVLEAYDFKGSTVARRENYTLA